MKIVLCHNFYRQAGGEDRVLCDEERLLASRGHEVVRFTKHSDSIAGQGNLRTAAGAIWNRKASRELRELTESIHADVVHFHNTVPLISPAAYYAARAGGAAVVQSLHNYRFICPKSTFFRDGAVCERCLGKWFAWPAVVNGCYRESKSASMAMAAMLATHRAIGTFHKCVDRYIAMSIFARGKLIEGGLPADKVELKPNFVAPDPGAGNGNGGYAMFLGRLSPEKGIDVLLRAWDQIGERVPLKVVGNGPMSDFVQKAASAHISVEWLSGQTDEQVRGLIAEASMLVMPSINYEGFPKTIVESFANGTPVVASRLGAMAEIIDDGRTGIHFESGNADDLAAKILELSGEPSRLTAMREQVRTEFEQRYSADENYELLMDIYDRAMTCRDAKRSPIGISQTVSPTSPTTNLPLEKA